MTAFIPGALRRRVPRNGNAAAHLKKSLLSTRQTASTFEFAYQARIAVERIRFAIRQTDQLAVNQPILQEVGMQLLDALDRLEMAERHFQELFRRSLQARANQSVPNGTLEVGRYKSKTE